MAMHPVLTCVKCASFYRHENNIFLLCVQVKVRAVQPLIHVRPSDCGVVVALHLIVVASN
jgi:hypothetical protein